MPEEVRVKVGVRIGRNVWRAWTASPPMAEVRVAQDGISLETPWGAYRFARPDPFQVMAVPGLFGSRKGWLGAGYRIRHSIPEFPPYIAFSPWSSNDTRRLAQQLETMEYL